MKKIFVMVMIAVLISIPLTSCNIKRLDVETAKQVLEEKLPLSYKVISAVYGDALEIADGTDIDESWTTPHYYKVKEDAVYTNQSQIKEDAEKIFSPTYLETIYEYAFEGNNEEMSRFGESDGILTIDVVKKPYSVLTDLYPETVKIIKSSRYAAVISVEGSADNGKTRKTVEINLSCIDGEWLFNGPTY